MQELTVDENRMQLQNMLAAWDRFTALMKSYPADIFPECVVTTIQLVDEREALWARRTLGQDKPL